MKKLTVKGCITRAANSYGDCAEVRLSLEDAKSGLRILDLEMSAEEFTKFLFAFYTEVNATIYPGHENWGKNLETKTMYFKIKNPKSSDREYLRSEFKKGVVIPEGWQLQYDPLDNMNNVKSTYDENSVTVKFTICRFVDETQS